LIWGASFLFIAEGLEILGPNGVTFARILIGFATLALFPAARRPLPRSGWAGAALLGLIWMAFPLSMFPYAEQRVSSALTGMLNGAMPLFAALVAAALSRRAPARGVVVGLAIGLAGVALVAWPSLEAGGSHADGVAMILAAVVSYGFAVNLARPLQVAHGALPVIWRAQAAALVMTAPLGLPELLEMRWSPWPFAAVVALGALGTGVALVLATVAAGRLGATRAAATTFLMPPVALALGVAVRGEQVALLSVVGGAVCVAGAWWIRRARERPVEPSAPLTPVPERTG
jgi:drug/metabolite transporter (DMT)-like permease